MKLMRNCREITTLVLQAEDRSLGAGERLAVRLHMLVCKACPVFGRQLQLMRRASQRWRQYTEGGADDPGQRR